MTCLVIGINFFLENIAFCHQFTIDWGQLMDQLIHSSPKLVRLKPGTWDGFVVNESVKLGSYLKAAARNAICHFISPQIICGELSERER